MITATSPGKPSTVTVTVSAIPASLRGLVGNDVARGRRCVTSAKSTSDVHLEQTPLEMHVEVFDEAVI